MHDNVALHATFLGGAESMELQQLRYFREVAEREHVTRAAER
jgi:hypothetical protein